MYISQFSLLILCCLSSYDFLNSLNIDTIVLIDFEFPEGANLLQKIPCGLLHVGNCKLNILVTNTQGPLKERVKHIWSLFISINMIALQDFPSL
jgi:hypothetical protein